MKKNLYLHPHKRGIRLRLLKKVSQTNVHRAHKLESSNSNPKSERQSMRDEEGKCH